MPNEKCRDCDEYAKQGHNYCRMCGYYLTRTFARTARIAVAYFTTERFCGFCGEERDKCQC
jgi:hypothetical protein